MAVPPVAALYTFTISPAASPVTLMVSSTPTLLFVAVILAATGATDTGSVPYVFTVRVLSSLFAFVTVT
ncbi:hypothetical protein D3C75_1030620 [compost metagenome]